MERLILRSVLWGADKVPDHWFERVPGGFYQSKDGRQQKPQTVTQKPYSSGSKGGPGHSSNSNRRHTSQYESRTHHGDRHEDKSRYDRQERNSTPGDRPMKDGEDEKQRHARLRPRSDGTVDRDHSYGIDSNHIAANQRHDNAEGSNHDSNYHRNVYSRSAQISNRDSRSIRGQTMMNGADSSSQFINRPSTRAQPLSPSQDWQHPSMDRRASLADGYVPYAHIYGGPPKTSAYPVNRPPSDQLRSNSPNKVGPPVMAPPGNYQQNPNAQLAPTAADAGAGAAYTGQNSGGYYGARIVDPYARRGPSSYDGEYSQPGPSSQSPNSDSSYDSDNDHDERVARSKVTRRSDNRHPNSSNGQNSKSRSRVREAFDTSQRGLGYGAVGALAGGLVGSEVGKGNRILPMAIGATVGALGANAFEARERRKDTSRHEQFSRDGTFDRGADKRYAEQRYHHSD